MDSSATHRVLAVFQLALAKPDFGPEDDFFIHGGNSQDAVEIASRLSDEFRVDVSPLVILVNGNPHDVAEAITTGNLMR
jgi:acyl carrier protein